MGIGKFGMRVNWEMILIKVGKRCCGVVRAHDTLGRGLDVVEGVGYSCIFFVVLPFFGLEHVIIVVFFDGAMRGAEVL